jgi:hypothetical protein
MRVTDISPERRSFHQGEFDKLKGEISDTIRTTIEAFKYSALSSAGIFTWLLANNISAVRNHLAIALWIPFGMSLAMATVAVACTFRLVDMGSYIAKLEDRLGVDGLGWERQLGTRRRYVAIAGAFAWILLLAGDCVVPMLIR